MRNAKTWLIIASTTIAVVGASEAALAVDCKRCESDIHSCSVILNDPDSYTDRVEEFCETHEPWQTTLVHRFPPDETNPCNENPSESSCRYCNGASSSCHEEWDLGGCHQPCGGENLAIGGEIANILARGDVRQLAGLVMQEEAVDFDPDERLIRIVAACGVEIERRFLLSDNMSSALRTEMSRRAAQP